MYTPDLAVLKTAHRYLNRLLQKAFNKKNIRKWVKKAFQA